MASKSKHMYNFFGLSKVNCNDFYNEEFVAFAKEAKFFEQHGFIITHHFLDRIKERDIHNDEIIESLNKIETHGKIVDRLDPSGERVKAYKCFGLTIIVNFDETMLITAYRGNAKRNPVYSWSRE